MLKAQRCCLKSARLRLSSANQFVWYARTRCYGHGRQQVQELRDVGQWLAYLKEPEPPRGLKELIEKLPVFKQVLNMPVKRLRRAPCQEIVWQGDEVDLDKIPVMSCWPDDVAPLLTWGLTITRGPHKKRQNLGIYRQQKIARNKVIMRWLAHRGGALDLRDWMEKHPGEPFLSVWRSVPIRRPFSVQ